MTVTQHNRSQNKMQMKFTMNNRTADRAGFRLRIISVDGGHTCNMIKTANANAVSAWDYSDISLSQEAHWASLGRCGGSTFFISVVSTFCRSNSGYFPCSRCCCCSSREWSRCCCCSSREWSRCCCCSSRECSRCCCCCCFFLPPRN